MNSNELLIAREKYNSMKNGVEELKKIKEEIEMLEQDPNVQRYLEICIKKSCKEYSDDFVINNALRGVNFEKINTYVYMGAFNYNLDTFKNYDYKAKDIESADYLLYYNLEDDLETEKISPKEQEEFEKDKTIIKLDTNLVTQTYCNIRKFYIEQLLKGNDEPIESIENNKAKLKVKEICR